MLTHIIVSRNNIHYEGRLCNRSMLKMNLRHSNSAQNFLKISELCRVCSMSLMNEKVNKTFN